MDDPRGAKESIKSRFYPAFDLLRFLRLKIRQQPPESNGKSNYSSLAVRLVAIKSFGQMTNNTKSPSIYGGDKLTVFLPIKLE